MTYQDFKKKYDGKYIDYDGCYGCQCWDLAQFYFTECLNLPDFILSGCGNVRNMLEEPKYSLLLKYFDEISVYEMCAGDVCIWGGAGNKSNHIAIFDHWDGNSNWYFSQNPNPCQVMQIDLLGLHAFRVKNKEKIDQILHVGSHVQIPGTFDVVDINVKDNTAKVRINGVDYWLSSIPLLEVE